MAPNRGIAVPAALFHIELEIHAAKKNDAFAARVASGQQQLEEAASAAALLNAVDRAVECAVPAIWTCGRRRTRRRLLGCWKSEC